VDNGNAKHRGVVRQRDELEAKLRTGAEALRTIYEDIPSRPNMTEAGRVALMAETARAALAKLELK
jgi:hypothetical protein